MLSRHSIAVTVLLTSSLCAQSWQPGPTIVTPGNVPRAGGFAVNSPAGFFLFGGTPANSAGDAQVQLWNGSTWATTTSLEGVYLHGGAATDELGRNLIIAGVDSGGAMGDSYEWTVQDGNAGGIQDRSGQAPDQGFATTTDAAGRVYSIGGSSASAFAVAAANGRVERFNATTDQWTALAPLPTPVADAGACEDGHGHLLVFGGFDTAGLRTANVAQYDVAAGTWSDTAVPDMPQARAGAGVARGADGLIYVIGGSDGSGAVTSTFVLDPVAATWRTGPAMATARQHFGCALDDAGNIWALGGDTTNTTEMLFTPTCPTVIQQPMANTAFRGGSAGFAVAVGGTSPFTYRWHKDGSALTDGPTPHGSTIAGAGTDQLAILGLHPNDAGNYSCVIGNACGSTISNSATLTIALPPVLPPAFVAQNLHPTNGALSSQANSVDGSMIVGSARYTHPQYNSLDHAIVWHQLGHGSVVDLTPANSVGSAANCVRQDAIVGWWWWPYTTPLGTGYYRQAAIWTGTGTVHHQAQVSGWEIGLLSATDGTHHTGTLTYDETSTNSNGFYWPQTGRSASSLTPLTAWGSGCNAIDGPNEYGQVHIGYGVVHAAKWNGASRDWTDMNPPGMSRSYITAAGNGQQVGTAHAGSIAYPGLWS
ncbi:MAG: immunoglobulin domain-containing protein, partial [Planctomycetes bacterium]|nr:immunoglobulin domain-containing protein [Planctomycetota bacterium]